MHNAVPTLMCLCQYLCDITCMYVPIYVRMCTISHVCMCLSMPGCVRSPMYVCAYLCQDVYDLPCMYVPIYVRMCTISHVCMCLSMPGCVRSPMYVCAYLCQDVYDHEASEAVPGVPGAGEAASLPTAHHRPQHTHSPHLWLPQRRQVQLHQQGELGHVCNRLF